MLKDRAARQGRNPRRGEAIAIAASNAKSGTVCRVLHVNERDGEPITYEIDELGDSLFPLSREELRQRCERAGGAPGAIRRRPVATGSRSRPV